MHEFPYYFIDIKANYNFTVCEGIICMRLLYSYSFMVEGRVYRRVFHFFTIFEIENAWGRI